MKKLLTLIIFSVMGYYSLQAQERFLDEVFDGVVVTENVTYGVNATLLYLPQTGEAVPQALLADIYEPAGDTMAQRPLVLVFHTGNFLPNVLNGQISGTMRDSAVVEICNRLARKGFVAASCDYRLGWNPLADNQPERALGLIQAAYRGIQDGKTAVRFFKKGAVDGGNPFRIDPNRITAWGHGTGGYLVLGMATLDNYLKIPQTTNGPGKFVLDTDGDGIPETPMVVPAFHGDVEGKVLTVTPMAAFGLPAGDTTNYPNHVLYYDGTEISSSYNLTVNIGGAIGDISWIDSNTNPIITVQSPYDIFAPYDDATLIVPTTGDPIVRVQGGLAIQRKMNELGRNDIFYDYVLDDDVTTLAKTNSETAGHEYLECLYPFIRPANSNGFDEGVVIDWWDPDAPAPGAGMNIPWNLLPHPSGGTFHEQGLILNENMSAEKARANIDEIMAYISPRMCIGLDLPCADMFSGVKDVTLEPSILSVSPNPASDYINIKVEDMTIERIQVVDMSGRLVKDEVVNDTQFSMQISGLNTGMYLVKAYLEKGVAATKIMVK